jgi:hypothetical protein
MDSNVSISNDSNVTFFTDSHVSSTPMTQAQLLTPLHQHQQGNAGLKK